jgi:hypothetical protein
LSIFKKIDNIHFFWCLKYQTKIVMPWTIRKLFFFHSFYMWHIYRLINLSIWSTFGEIVIKKEEWWVCCCCLCVCVCVFLINFMILLKWWSPFHVVVSKCGNFWRFKINKIRGICDSQKYSFFLNIFHKMRKFSPQKSHWI